MDKVWASPEAALDDLHDGASIAVSGFGTSHGFACSLLVAARDKGVKNLTLVSNWLGVVGQMRGVVLVASGQVSKLIVSFSSRPGMHTPAEDLIEAGDIEVELVPQGTLVERMRAAGAGIPAFYTPTGVGTPIADGKEVRYFHGKPHILEQALPVDYAFLKAYRADRLGNIEMRGSSRNFNPAFAKAARRQARLDTPRDGASHRGNAGRWQLCQSRHRYSDPGVELHRRPRHHVARGKRDPRLRSHGGGRRG
jgi:3-oxoacid CoA-transferase